MASYTRKAIIIGLSGCSSSGKTTLARLLRDIFPSTFILHEDDFYRAEEELPSRDGLLDWDCAESLDLDQMQKALEHIQKEGTFPPFIDSKEDLNSIGPCPVSPSIITSLKSHIQTLYPTHLPQNLTICILDGFLLYSPSIPSSIQSLIDLKFFLLVFYSKAKARREARTGYVTLEGFWEDPPEYVDKIVWPNYVRDHRWLFEEGDVEGRVDDKVVKREGIRVYDGGEEKERMDVGMEGVLEWIVGEVVRELKGVEGGKYGEDEKA